MYTCTKVYTDIPFAHRQHKHPGQCAYIHGHNWSIQLTFVAKELDEKGFVLDFGELDYIRIFFEKNLDHACVLNEDDPIKNEIIALYPGLLKPYIVPNCSCEGLAKHFYELFNPELKERTQGRVNIVSICISENAYNSATYKP